MTATLRARRGLRRLSYARRSFILAALLHGVRRLGLRLIHSLTRHLLAATAPSAARVIVDTLADLPRSKGVPIAENALLRQQLVVLQRSVKRVHCTPTDRALLVLLASRVRAWGQAALIARLSGVGYHEAVATLALRPLSLHDSFLPVAPAHWPRIAQVADAAYAGLPHESFNSPYFRSLGLPWGGLYATARDIHRFLTYFLVAWPADDDQAETATERDGSLSSATRRAMTVAQVAVPPASPHPDDDLDVRAWPLVEWGLGWEIKGSKRPHRTGELTSPRTFTHAGASGALMWVDPCAGRLAHPRRCARGRCLSGMR